MPSLTAITGNPTIPLRQEREIARFEADARRALDDLTPKYRERSKDYATSGVAPFSNGPSAA